MIYDLRFMIVIEYLIFLMNLRALRGFEILRLRSGHAH
jgi:hypothetical protein